jgi:lysophospholipase L1-like esterase
MMPGLYSYSAYLPTASDHQVHFYWLLCGVYTLALLGLLYWTWQPHRGEAMRRSTSAVVATIFVLFGVEAVMARVTPSDALHAGLIFPPHSTAHYESSEFVFDARIDNLGIRDRDFPLVKNRRLRILALGDSTTYGWGVDIEQAWPKVLEKELQAKGLDVEVLDLGKPGTGPVQYADLAEVAIPLLKPDLVLVDLLQGDDLRQSNNTEHQSTPLEHFSSRPAEEVFPTLTRWITDQTIMHTRSTGPEWRAEVSSMERGLNDAQRDRLAHIDPQIRDLWDRGRLNPGSFVIGIKYETYFTSMIDIDSPLTKLLIDKCGQALTRIRRCAQANGSNVLALSLPWGLYISQHNYDDFKRLGIEVDPRMLSTDDVDETYRRATTQAEVPFRSYTPALRHESLSHHLFFDLDCHFNPYGNDYFAHLVEPDVEAAIRHAP